MRTKYILMISLFFSMSSIACTQEIATVDSLLKTSLKASGGADAWNRIKTLTRYQAIRTENGASKSNSGTTFTADSDVTAIYKLPHYYYTEVKKIARIEGSRQVGVGVPAGFKMTWYQPDGSKTPIPSSTTGPNYPCTELQLMNRLPGNAVPLTQAVTQGKECFAFTIKLEKFTSTYSYDKSTYLLFAVESEQGGLTSSTYFEDYRSIEGVLISYRQEKTRGSADYSLVPDVQIEALELNTAIEDSFFENEYKKLE